LSDTKVRKSQDFGLKPSSRAGRNSTALRKANKASKVMPMRRNGNDSSQTSGHKIKASKANGQQSTSKMHQPIKVMNDFIFASQFFTDQLEISLMIAQV
jgi:hypothetical protein